MGTIADKLTYLNGTKNAIKDAIVAKGVAVSGTDTFRSYATKISEIPSGEVVYKKKYGMSIDNIFGNVDENGKYTLPSVPFTPDFSSIKILPSFALYNKFYRNDGVTGDIVFGFESVSGSYAMSYAFQFCINITSISFPALTTINGNYAIAYSFQGCAKLKSVSFPALKEILPETSQNQLASMFTGSNALTEIHFPAAMQARIEQLDTYANKFGATNATIYFDL